MHNETKEEFLNRLRKEQGIENLEPQLDREDDTEQNKPRFKDKLKGFFFMLLFLVFLVAIIRIFGMMSGN